MSTCFDNILKFPYFLYNTLSVPITDRTMFIGTKEEIGHIKNIIKLVMEDVAIDGDDFAMRKFVVKNRKTQPNVVTSNIYVVRGVRFPLTYHNCRNYLINFFNPNTLVGDYIVFDSFVESFTTQFDEDLNIEKIAYTTDFTVNHNTGVLPPLFATIMKMESLEEFYCNMAIGLDQHFTEDFLRHSGIKKTYLFDYFCYASMHIYMYYTSNVELSKNQLISIYGPLVLKACDKETALKNKDKYIRSMKCRYELTEFLLGNEELNSIKPDYYAYPIFVLKQKELINKYLKK